MIFYIQFFFILSLSQKAANEVHSFPRGSNLIPEQNSAYFRSLPKSLPSPACLILPETSQVIRVMPTSSTPSGAFENGRFIIILQCDLVLIYTNMYH